MHRDYLWCEREAARRNRGLRCWRLAFPHQIQLDALPERVGLDAHRPEVSSERGRFWIPDPGEVVAGGDFFE